MNDLLNFAQEDGLFGVEVEQYQQEHTLNTMEGCNSLYQWLQGKEDDDFLFKNQPNLTADEAFAVIYYLQERFHVIPDTIEKCSCCNELYDSEDADVQEKIGDERERACCRNCCCEEEEIRNIEVFYRRDDKMLISKKELIQLIEDDKTDEIISRFKLDIYRDVFWKNWLKNYNFRIFKNAVQMILTLIRFQSEKGLALRVFFYVRRYCLSDFSLY